MSARSRRVGDAHQNYVQRYTVTRTINGTATVISGSTSLLVPPPNIGNNVTPFYNDANEKPISGAKTRAALDSYTQQTTYEVTAGGATYSFFAGLREDGFYSDIAGIFDLLNSRIATNDSGRGLGQDGGGPDLFKGFNVLHYAIQIPLSALPSYTYTGALQPQSTGVGVYASVSRPQMTLRSSTGADTGSGGYVQVNREANPLFNEVLVALVDKDNYNRTSPTDDASKFAKYALNPENCSAHQCRLWHQLSDDQPDRPDGDLHSGRDPGEYDDGAHPMSRAGRTSAASVSSELTPSPTARVTRFRRAGQTAGALATMSSTSLSRQSPAGPASRRSPSSVITWGRTIRHIT